MRGKKWNYLMEGKLSRPFSVVIDVHFCGYLCTLRSVDTTLTHLLALSLHRKCSTTHSYMGVYLLALLHNSLVISPYSVPWHKISDWDSVSSCLILLILDSSW